MHDIENRGLKDNSLWKLFVKDEQLTEHQADQFERYLALILEWNEKINLTRITDLSSIIAYHFQDSLKITHYVDFSIMRGVGDVGTGAGFPGIPLSIKFPNLPITLLEVCMKKAAFLRLVIQELGLTQCQVNILDWRTFLRQTNQPIDIFLSRASLQPEELVRMFKPISPYKDGQLVYWASGQWQAQGAEKDFLVRTCEYQVGGQRRLYAFFKR